VLLAFSCRAGADNFPLQAYQKDAILRQMNEYKREQKYWQKEFTKLSEKLTHHDDHLRTIDAWFSQLLDEVRILAADTLPTPPTSATSASGRTYRSTNIEEYIC
jgi:E3 ubiquitin-protein ligase BRE1